VIGLIQFENASKLLIKLANYFKNLLKVVPVLNPFCFKSSVCGRAGAKIPDSNQCERGEIKDIDLQVYVTSRPSPEGVLAYATFCAVSNGLERPIAAWINISPMLLTEKFTEDLAMSIIKHGKIC
jgi:hypothetical protein